MACELKSREFENSKGDKLLVSSRELAATAALDLHVELIGKLGTSVFQLIDNKYEFGDLINLMRQAENKVITELVKRVVCMATVDGKEIRPALFDMTYSGELMLVFKVFAFVCEVNFNDFFKQGLAINEQRSLEAAEASKMAEQKNTSPQTI